jgi:UDP-N-acetylmuramate dehydrogenase
MSTLPRGVIHTHVPLVHYTSWQVGGLAQKLYLPSDMQDLAILLRETPLEEPVFFIGLGSNLLIRDAGIAGTVIVTQGGLNHLSAENGLVRAEAGVACAQMARFCARNNLGGAEFLAGIPGTVGGALAMNAGCYDGETWKYVEQVETVDRTGCFRIRPATDYQVSYRSVMRPKDEWFVAGHFRLPPGKKAHSLEKIRDLLDRRAATQPTSEPNCGSVFRNPPNDHAARLIEACGLKGFAIGGARVSTKHANFIINENSATALDIERLILHIQQMVTEKFDIHLIQEVQTVGCAYE